MYQADFNKVFGNIGNGKKVVGYTDATKKHTCEMRVGKTARDKANGHVAYQKNRRVWDNVAHKWVKL